VKIPAFIQLSVNLPEKDFIFRLTKHGKFLLNSIANLVDYRDDTFARFRSI